jgi:predicted enzyme related to lactoylglutathione lyase
MHLLVNIDVPDIEKGVEFYTAAFGFQIGRRLGATVVELLGGGPAVYLLEKAPGTDAAPVAGASRAYGRHWTPVHLDVVVEDVHAGVARAVAAGAVVESKVATHDWGHIAMLADPFGHGICLIEFRNRGYDELLK